MRLLFSSERSRFLRVLESSTLSLRLLFSSERSRFLRVGLLTREFGRSKPHFPVRDLRDRRSDRRSDRQPDAESDHAPDRITVRRVHLLGQLLGPCRVWWSWGWLRLGQLHVHLPPRLRHVYTPSSTPSARTRCARCAGRARRSGGPGPGSSAASPAAPSNAAAPAMGDPRLVSTESCSDKLFARA